MATHWDLAQHLLVALTTPSHYLNHCWLIVPRLSDGKSGDYKIVSFRLSVRPFGTFGRCHTTTTGPIGSTPSSIEPPWPKDDLGLLSDTQNCGLCMRRECRERFPATAVSDPDMHHGTCVTHVPWCMPGSLTSRFLWSRRRGKRSRHYRHMPFVETSWGECVKRMA